MRTVQLTIDEELLKEVDAAASRAKTTRSAFARRAFRSALDRLNEAALERKHREGYRRKPVLAKEFQPWEGQQAWGDD